MTPQDSTATDPLTAVNVSVFTDHHEKAPRHPKRTLAAVVGRLRGDFDDDDHPTLRAEAETVAALRAAVDRDAPDEERRAIKATLGAFTPGGVFTHRKIAGLVGIPSGVTVVDVDKLDPAAVEPLRQRGEALPGCVVAFVSPSGRGVKYIVRLDPHPTNAADHDAATRAVMATYAKRLGVEVDGSGKDVSRLCYFSRDPKLLTNTEVDAFGWEHDAPVLQSKPAPRAKRKTPAVLAKMAPDTGRNQYLNDGAFADGAAGRLSDELETAWRDAGASCGLPADEIDSTIQSAKAAGKAKPRPSRDVSGFPAAVAAALEELTGAGLGGLSARVSALAEAVDGAGLDKPARAAVKAAAMVRLKDALSLGAPEAREVLGALSGNGAGLDRLAGSALAFAEVKAAADPLPLADLLDELARHLRRFMHLPAGAVETVAAWVAWTYVEPHSYILPILAVTAPTKGCGKSTLLRVMARFIERPDASVSPTSAALFRFVESSHPTMMLDEADVWMKGRDEGAAAVRAVVNEGHMRGGGVLRCVTVGDNFEVRRFRCDCPKAVAGIGDFMASATADRCIIITLDKAPRSVRLENFRGDRPLAPELPGLLKRWADDHGEDYAAHDPDTGGLTNRDADNWRPLYGVADLAGGEWPRRIREASRAVSGRSDKRTEKQGRNERLLTDAFKVFDAAGSPTLLTGDFDKALLALPDGPYGDWTHGKDITPQARGRILNTFGINVSEGGGYPVVRPGRVRGRMGRQGHTPGRTRQTRRTRQPRPKTVCFVGFVGFVGFAQGWVWTPACCAC